MVNLLIDALSWLCLLGGGFFVIVGAVGLLRMPDFFTRLHASSVTDTLGAGLLLAGMALQAGFSQASIKLGLILLFLFFTSPTATHALAKAALHGNLRPLTGSKAGEGG